MLSVSSQHSIVRFMSLIKWIICYCFVVILTIFYPIESSASNKIVTVKQKLSNSGFGICKKIPVKDGTESVQDNAQTFTVYGPVIFEGGIEKHQLQTDRFNVYNPDTEYYIRVKNEVMDGSARWWKSWRQTWRYWVGKFRFRGRSKPKLAHVKVFINGKLVVGHRGLKKKNPEIIKPISLNEDNQIDVLIRSKTDSRISIEVYGLDRDLPTISTTLSPEPNSRGWNNTDVVVNFVCDDITSGVSACPEPVTITQEGAAQVLTGEVVDNAGQTASLDVIVNLDRTPPQIGLTWPPMDQFGTDRHQVPLEGGVEDQLSGPISLVVEDHNGSANGTVPSFVLSRDLLTEIPPSEVSRESSFTLVAQDAAGNEASLVQRVRHTLAATVVPTDPTRTEFTNGALKSYDRALILLDSETSRDRAHEIVGQHGGRVAGYLPFTNIVLAQFDTRSVAELESLLVNMELETDVAKGNAVFFMTPDQLDNEHLSPEDAIAYTNVRLPEAIDFINDNGLDLNPVSIAIIDSGIDATFGRNNEFANIVMYDMCTSSGREGIPSSPGDFTGHGTQVTGVIVGENNGEGNNGIVRGLPDSDFQVSVFRANCYPGNERLDSGLILMAFSNITFSSRITGIDVVNMSFSTDSELSDDVVDYYDGYFNSPVGRDILWVASAGNDAREIDCTRAPFPAAMSCLRGNVMAVGGSNPNTDGQWIYSNYGDAVSIFAPGTDVFTATFSNTYGLTEGTSRSAAMVTGAAAILESVHPQGPINLRHAIEHSAQPLVSATAPQGSLDMFAMLQEVPLPPLPTFSNTGRSEGVLKHIVMSGDEPKPGLSGFMLGYTQSDHKIRIVQAGYFPRGDDPAHYYGLVDYQDSNGDDDYDYQLNGISLPPGTIYDSISRCVTNGGDATHNIGSIDPAYYPVLVGFKLNFNQGNNDHNLLKMAVDLKKSVDNFLKITTAFGDGNPSDDSYCYTVEYALVPISRVRTVVRIDGEHEKGSASVDIDAQQPVLAGFRLNFENGDHNIDQVGVSVLPHRAKVWMNDHNNDDEFAWYLRYVDLR